MHCTLTLPVDLQWRYTEWAEWDGKALRPAWERGLGNEMYTHVNDKGFDFDLFENDNQNSSNLGVRQALSNMLREMVANFTRLH
jgi:hypothetical protein